MKQFDDYPINGILVSTAKGTSAGPGIVATGRVIDNGYPVSVAAVSQLGRGHLITVNSFMPGHTGMTLWAPSWPER